MSLHSGIDYSSWIGVSYAYLPKEAFPILLGADVQMSFGNQWADDWKAILSGRYEIWQTEHISWDMRTGLILRSYASEAATLTNFGLDIQSSIGYSSDRWGIAGIFTYDKAFATYVQHDQLKEFYPEIQDTWLGPTGGNVQIGIRGNYAWENWQVFLKLGKTYGQNFRDHPTLPFFVEASLVKSL